MLSSKEIEVLGKLGFEVVGNELSAGILIGPNGYRLYSESDHLIFEKRPSPGVVDFIFYPEESEIGLSVFYQVKDSKLVDEWCYLSSLVGFLERVSDYLHKRESIRDLLLEYQPIFHKVNSREVLTIRVNPRRTYWKILNPMDYDFEVGSRVIFRDFSEKVYDGSDHQIIFCSSEALLIEPPKAPLRRTSDVVV